MLGANIIQQRNEIGLGDLTKTKTAGHQRGGHINRTELALQHPFGHGPGHLGKPWQEITLVQRKARHLVHRVGDQLGTVGKFHHANTVRIGSFTV